MTSRSRHGHFTPELFAFLRALKRHNERDWFERNRGRYLEHVRDPMLRFIADFEPYLHAVSGHFVADPSPTGGSMFRIYRDVRFSKNRRPYKTAATAQFRHERGRDVHAPGFYLHLEPGQVFAASGMWRPDGPSLARIRLAIVNRSQAWKRMRALRVFRSVFETEGGSRKRPPRGFDPGHPLVEDLRRTDHIVSLSWDEQTACSPDFLPRFARFCRDTSPLMRFLASALDLEW